MDIMDDGLTEAEREELQAFELNEDARELLDDLEELDEQDAIDPGIGLGYYPWEVDDEEAA